MAPTSAELDLERVVAQQLGVVHRGSGSLGQNLALQLLAFEPALGFQRPPWLVRHAAQDDTCFFTIGPFNSSTAATETSANA